VQLARTSSAVGTSVSPLSWSHVVDSGVNRLLVVAVSLRAFQTVTSVTFGDVALSKHQSVQGGAGNYPRAELWYLVAPAVGRANVVVTMSGAEWVEAGALNFINAHQGLPLGPAATASSTGPGPASVTALAALGDLVVDCLAYNTANATAAAGQVERIKVSSDGNWRLGCSTKPGAASTKMSWGLISAWAQVAAAVKAASI